MKGRFQPKNPSKYLGNPTNIIWRSKWELDLMMILDNNPEVVGWSSEETIIPYKSPLDGRWHRYFVDFLVKTKNKETILIEVKPFQQTLEPTVPKKRTRAFLSEAATYVVNQAKWNAAEEYCADRKWKFKIITEKELYGK
jgi:hypothetical protein